MIHLKADDVLVLGDGPIRPIRAVRHIVNRIIAAEPFEIRLPDIVEIKLRITDVDLVKRRGRGMQAMIEADWNIHYFSPCRCLCTTAVGLLALSPTIDQLGAGSSSTS